MYNSHRLIAQTVGRTWGAVISKTSKTAPKPSPKACENQSNLLKIKAA